MNRKKWMIIGAVVVLIVAVGVGLLACSDEDKDKEKRTAGGSGVVSEQGNDQQSGNMDDGDAEAQADDEEAGTAEHDEETGDSDNDGKPGNTEENQGEVNDGKDTDDDADADTDDDSDKDDQQNQTEDNGKMTYEKYVAMSAEDQQAYFETYDDPADFFDWYNAEKKKYDDKRAEESETGDSIDLGDYID